MRETGSGSNEGRESDAAGATRRRFLRGVVASGAGAVAGCSGDSMGGTATNPPTATPERTIRVAGSSTVYPLTLRVATAFAARRDGVSVSVTSTGTGGGFTDYFCVGETDINDASRPIASDERSQCAANGVEFVRFRVATDALTVVVNADADWVDCVTPAELAAIWRTDGARQWSDVRPEWPAKPIEPFGPTPDSGTFDYFAEEVLGAVDRHRQDYDGTEQDSTIVESVRNTRYGIGYLGFAYYDQNRDAVRALAVDDGTGCVRPSLSTAKRGTYAPLSRPLFVYVARDSLAEAPVRAFLRAYLDRVDTDLVSDVGYVPLDAETAARNRAKLDRVGAEVTGESTP